MRAEGAGGSPAAERAQLPAGRVEKREDFRGALRWARERQGREGREGRAARPEPADSTSPPASTPTSSPISSDTSPALAAGRAAELAGRAVVAVAAQRAGAGAALRIETAEGIRYELAAGTGGVELRALAPPLLEHVARADLHAVADGCGQRGVRLARAAVELAGGRGRKEPGGKR